VVVLPEAVVASVALPSSTRGASYTRRVPKPVDLYKDRLDVFNFATIVYDEVIAIRWRRIRYRARTASVSVFPRIAEDHRRR
jgi:hypothetical protein